MFVRCAIGLILLWWLFILLWHCHYQFVHFVLHMTIGRVDLLLKSLAYCSEPRSTDSPRSSSHPIRRSGCGSMFANSDGLITHWLVTELTVSIFQTTIHQGDYDVIAEEFKSTLVFQNITFLPPQLFVKNLSSYKEAETLFSTYGKVFAVQPHQSRPE